LATSTASGRQKCFVAEESIETDRRIAGILANVTLQSKTELKELVWNLARRTKTMLLPSNRFQAECRAMQSYYFRCQQGVADFGLLGCIPLTYSPCLPSIVLKEAQSP